MGLVRMLVLLSTGLVGWTGVVGAADEGQVGTFVAVQGTVTLQPASLTAPQPVKAYDPIGPLAIIETKASSRVKILFVDDTLITLGEQSRLEMTEQAYRGVTRTFVAHLTRGTARVLVERPVTEENSVFEVHSRTAVATVRGTYFVIWIEEPVAGVPGKERSERSRGARAPSVAEAADEAEGATGIANIGSRGDIAFTSGGATVLVLPSQSSIALPGGQPSMPVGVEGQATGAGPVAAAVARTVLPDVPRQESLRSALASTGMAGEGEGLSQPTMMAGALGGQFPSGAYAVPGWPFPVTPVTPPAVVSGVAEVPNRFSIGLPR